MRTIDINQARTELSELVDQAAAGEPFLIAKAGKALAMVTALDTPSTPRRLGFLQGEIVVPEDFDSMNQAEIVDLFKGGD